MSTSYHRDAFAELMSQIGQNEMDRAFAAGEYSGGGKQEESASGQGDFFQNLVNGILSAPAATTGVSGPGFSVGSIGSTAYMPAGTYDGNAPITEGFSSDVFGTSMFQQPVNISGVSTNLRDYGFNLGGGSTLATDFSGGIGSFQPIDKLYPGNVGYNPNTDPDAYYASQGMSTNPITGKFIDLSKYNVTGGGDASSTTGQVPTSTSTASGANEVLVTGQSGGNTGLTAANTGAGILGANTNIAGEVVATGSQDDGKDLKAVDTGAGILGSTLPTEIVITGSQEDDSPLIKSIINNPAIKTLNTITGGKINEIISIGRAIKDDGFVKAALGALNLDNITLPAETGNTYVDSDFELLMPGGVDLDSRSNIENVGSTGTGGAYDINNLAAIRSVVPGTYDPNRRAGSGGQRYFSDVRYAPQEGVAGAQAAANAQAMMLAYQNALNPAYQVQPGGTVDRATSMAQRAMGLAGLIPTTVTGTIPAARTTTTGGTSTTGTTGTATTGGTGTTGTATTGGTGTATTDSTSPYTYTSESLFQGIDPSDGFDETEIGRVAALLNQKYTTADQVGEFFNMSAEDVNRYLGDYNKRTELIKNLGLTEGQQGFTFDQLSKLGASGLENQYLADTFGVDADALQRAIAGAGTITGLESSDGLDLTEQGTIAALLESGDASVANVANLYGITPEEVQAGYSNYKNTVAQNAINETIDSGDFDAIAELVTSGKAGIGDVANRQGVEGMDVIEDLLRGGYETPAQMVERLAAANEGLNEEKLIASLLETDRATPKEVAAYYGIPVEAVTARYKELGGTKEFAQGGNVSGYYLGGTTDGMADQIPATINDMQPAALSDGEFVIPADVVSHLGNGNSDAGAKELYSMMDRIRKDRTGTTKQGRQIDPNKYLA